MPDREPLGDRFRDRVGFIRTALGDDPRCDRVGTGCQVDCGVGCSLDPLRSLHVVGDRDPAHPGALPSHAFRTAHSSFTKRLMRHRLPFCDQSNAMIRANAPLTRKGYIADGHAYGGNSGALERRG